MLGRLARWLRAGGYDTIYDAALDDRTLARLARQEGRVLLTRDRELARRKGLRTVLIESDKLPAQLRQLRPLVGRPAKPFSRCLVCNTPLHPVDAASVESRVPEYVWETQREFRLCRHCGRVYWRGSHRRAMEAALSAHDGDDGS